ncbi:Protein-like protein [Operophtera brumata]|uniref:Protein-like protein n=1 Tax=Operophtera brumata TaxID=104452 RepID=A0A0L7LGM6_OPEBR|nr:Protein-like protein [Operophtera brumata]
MKGGLCVIYTSLLTISVLSSCALLILVVSEAVQPDGGIDTKVDLSGFHNVSQKPDTGSEDEPREPVDETPPKDDVHEEKKASFEDQEMIFAEALSLNSVTTDG